ncbi:MAG: hypothetical protein VXX76_03225 [SAR324 cluster bacterium]|nr:hypothetical protein [SAR324 cluster bacterium]
MNALMEQIPPGKLTTIGRIREFLARSHGVETACPLTTGIFFRIAAEVAMESQKKKGTPKPLPGGGPFKPMDLSTLNSPALSKPRC